MVLRVGAGDEFLFHLPEARAGYFGVFESCFCGDEMPVDLQG